MLLHHLDAPLISSEGLRKSVGPVVLSQKWHHHMFMQTGILSGVHAQTAAV
jgi:hypothetical protein